jgi:NAD(P)-dependent dehydrogenase (short-subunit alcohol dehydrogenase family)
MSPYEGLNGATAVVLGASSGIGLEVCRQAAGHGASVVMLSRSAERLHAARATLPVDAAVTVAAVDMLDPSALAATFGNVGSIDHLVVTAVADETKLEGPITEMSDVKAEQAMSKFCGSFNACRAAVPHMRATGSITLTSSVAIHKPPSDGGYAVANAASAAVATLSRSLAAELKPVRVNAVLPGVVDSGVWSDLGDSRLDSMRQWAADSLPVRHIGQPTELAAAYLHLMVEVHPVRRTGGLCGDAVTATVVQVLPVDGAVVVVR